MSGRGLRIEVSGPDRHQVVGLFDRISEILTRRQAFRRLDRDWVIFGLGAPLLFVGSLAGSWIPRAVGPADRNGEWDPAEIVGLALGPTLAVAICTGLWWLYPPFEILNANEKTRAERFAKGFWGFVVAIITGLIATAIWWLAAG